MRNFIKMDDWILNNPKPNPKKFNYFIFFDRSGYEIAYTSWERELSKELSRRYTIFMERFVSEVATKVATIAYNTLKSYPKPQDVEVTSLYDSLSCHFYVKTLSDEPVSPYTKISLPFTGLAKDAAELSVDHLYLKIGDIVTYTKVYEDSLNSTKESQTLRGEVQDLYDGRVYVHVLPKRSSLSQLCHFVKHEDIIATEGPQ